MFGAGANERWRPLRKSKMKMQPNPMKLFIDRIYIYTAVFRFIIPTKFIFLNSEKVKNKNKNKKKNKQLFKVCFYLLCKNSCNDFRHYDFKLQTHPDEIHDGNSAQMNKIVFLNDEFN